MTRATIRRITTAALTLAAACAFATAWDPASGDAARAGDPPNLIVVMTDDQTLASMRPDVLSRAVGQIGERGATFTQSFAAPPLCCPSRAGFITGQYPHNHGVFSNRGGYETLVGKANTLPVWLDRAGYRTGFVGKYLNHYPNVGGTDPAPGWDFWFSIHDRGLPTIPYYDTPVSDNGRRTNIKGFLSNALNRQADAFVRTSAERGRPFFLWLAHLAPHGGVGKDRGRCSFGGPVPAPDDEGAFATDELPRDPSFNEADVSDKPSFIRQTPRLSEEDIRLIQRWHECALESLLSVDRGIALLVRTLRDLGELDDTAIIFTSDNGYIYGDHRRKLDKSLPYEDSIRVPLLIRPPAGLGAVAGEQIAKPVANIDLAPTLLALAGARPCAAPGRCRTLDGHNLLPLLRGNGSGFPGNRGILLELGRAAGGRHAARYPCRYSAIRTPAELYAEYPIVVDEETRECVPADEAELYDLEADPFELENLLARPLNLGERVRREELAARLAALRECRGIPGRDPLPRSGEYCE